MKVAIIGAGLSGSNIYHPLKTDNNNITIFEKSRGAGGRCSTRYLNDKLIDHGTPFFKVKDQQFKEFCDDQVYQNILTKKDDIYYPVDGMNKLCSSLIDQEDILLNTHIVSFEKLEDGWHLIDKNSIGYGAFDKLIITIPAPQVLELDISLPNDIKNKLQSVKYNSIATLMIYSHSFQSIDDKKFLDSTSFKKIVNNSNKYHYENFSSYVIHLNETLSNEQNFRSKDEVKSYMIRNIKENFGFDIEKDFYILPHLWKYGFVSEGVVEEYIYDEKLGLGFCGDYFKHRDLQGSYSSSSKLFSKIV